jgi:ABC-type nitrate/sulfonate/bicarbonate transport system permease component
VARVGTSTVVASRPASERPRLERWQSLLGSRWLHRAVVWGGLVGVWYALAVWKGPFFMATPAATVRGLGRLASEGYLPTVATSLRQLSVGFGLAVAFGIPVGLLMGSARAVDDFLAPYVNTLFVTSKEALLPFLITLFGVALEFRVAVVFLFAVFFIIMNTAAGVRGVDAGLLETARAFRVPRRRILTKVVLPASLPYVIAGLRLGLATAIKGMVIAELWVTAGVGLLLKNFGAFRRLDMFFALSIVIIAIGVVSTSLLRLLERRLQSARGAS